VHAGILWHDSHAYGAVSDGNIMVTMRTLGKHTCVSSVGGRAHLAAVTAAMVSTMIKGGLIGFSKGDGDNNNDNSGILIMSLHSQCSRSRVLAHLLAKPLSAPKLRSDGV
jgi:hypothetical protein